MTPFRSVICFFGYRYILLLFLPFWISNLGHSIRNLLFGLTRRSHYRKNHQISLSVCSSQPQAGTGKGSFHSASGHKPVFERPGKFLYSSEVNQKTVKEMFRVFARVSYKYCAKNKKYYELDKIIGD